MFLLEDKMAKQTRNEYHNEWQKRNRDKVRQAQNRYWKKKAQEKQKNNNIERSSQ